MPPKVNRPTRKLEDLQRKLKRKKAASRLSGNKARRWQKAAEKYKALSAVANEES